VSDDKEAAKAIILGAEARLSEILTMMESCPYEDSFDRVASIMGIIELFNLEQARLLAAVTINRFETLVRGIQKMAETHDAQ
jgi:hypothetical protein